MMPAGFLRSAPVSISAGAESEYDGNSEAVKGWLVGLNWKDAFMEGNKLGLGFGSYSSYATAVKGQGYPDDTNFAIEAYYDFRVTDNITVTPAIFWVDDAKGSGANRRCQQTWWSCEDLIQVLI